MSENMTRGRVITLPDDHRADVKDFIARGDRLQTATHLLAAIVTGETGLSEASMERRVSSAVRLADMLIAALEAKDEPVAVADTPVALNTLSHTEQVLLKSVAMMPSGLPDSVHLSALPDQYERMVAGCTLIASGYLRRACDGVIVTESGREFLRKKD
jgi:hypothetical protein